MNQELEHRTTPNKILTQKQHFQPNLDITSNNNNKNIRYSNWEKYRTVKYSPNITPSNTVLNSPDIAEVHQHQQHKLRIGQSPILLQNTNDIYNDNNNNEDCSLHTVDTPPIATTNQSTKKIFVTDGEIVIFDDIDNVDLRNNQTSSDMVTEMVGILPITEYDESPRRIGNYNNNGHQTNQKYIPKLPLSRNLLTSPTLPPPRLPGFPQRVKSGTDLELQQTDEFSSRFRQSSKMTPADMMIVQPKTETFDYLYEFSDTRKVLEDFFQSPNIDESKRFPYFLESESECNSNAYIGKRLAKSPNTVSPWKQHKHNSDNNDNQQQQENYYDNNDRHLYHESDSGTAGRLSDTDCENHNHRSFNRHFTLSPETTDYDSNYGDLDSLSNTEITEQIAAPDLSRLHTNMPVLEDGLSSGHASESDYDVYAIHTDNCCIAGNSNEYDTNNNNTTKCKTMNSTNTNEMSSVKDDEINVPYTNNSESNHHYQYQLDRLDRYNNRIISSSLDSTTSLSRNSFDETTIKNMDNHEIDKSTKHSSHDDEYYENHDDNDHSLNDLKSALNDIELSVKRDVPITKTMTELGKANCDCDVDTHEHNDQLILSEPVWIPRCDTSTVNDDSINSDNEVSKPLTAEDEEHDTDLETDRLLGCQQKLLEKEKENNYDDEEKNWSSAQEYHDHDNPNSTIQNSSQPPVTTVQQQLLTCTPQPQHIFSTSTLRQGVGTSLVVDSNNAAETSSSDNGVLSMAKNMITSRKSPGSNSLQLKNNQKRSVGPTRTKEVHWEPAVLIEGVLFRAKYLGSTQLVCEGQPTKSTRMLQAEEAVSRIKAPEGESQPSTEVDLFISTEKIMVLNTDLKEIMMDHALRTISYIADIGDLVVLMARRRFVTATAATTVSSSTETNNNNDGDVTTTTTEPVNDSDIVITSDDCPDSSVDESTATPATTVITTKINRTPKMICHVFESEEAQFIAQSIGQAFQVAYMEFLKANGIEDHSFVKEMDYQEVLNSQEIFGDELKIFAKKELQKEIVVPKAKGEILGVVIVESGWGSMLPTVVIANLLSTGAAARCGQLNIGDQIIAINGLSLVGLPLNVCQSYIRNSKNQTAVKFTVVPCPPVVEVKIKRPNTKYQLGFSVQNGVICSLLRGGIAERGGVRVGHRIIEINNQSVVAVPHEKIVNLLATSVGEILMKTMPTSMFRLLTGQENPLYI